MTRKRKVARALGTGAAALTMLGAFSVQTLRQEPMYQTLSTPSAYSLTCKDATSPYRRQKPTPEPDIRPVSAYTREDRVTAPPTPQPALVGGETADVEPHSAPPAEIDFELQKPHSATVISTTKEPPRDNPTPSSTASKNTAGVPLHEPQMGDTRSVDGQKQVYFLGFGWIEDNDTPNECTYAEDMYENGNKVGSMGDTFVDGDGDINKMVGTMGDSEVGRSCGDINKPVGHMD